MLHIKPGSVTYIYKKEYEMASKNLTEACSQNDYAYIAGWLNAKYGVEVTADALPRLLRREGLLAEFERSSFGGLRDDRWGDSSWGSWWSLRLQRSKLFPKCGEQSVNNHIPSVTLNIFFIFLEETQEMLARLPEKDNTSAVSKGQEARSKIFRTELVPQPIDITAARVAGMQQ